MGLDSEFVQDFRAHDSRNSGLYRALAARPELEVVDRASPQLSPLRRHLINATHVLPRRDQWRLRAALSPARFRALSAQAESELAAREGAYDVVLELYCLFAPGRLERARPYALYLDTTLALTWRGYRPAAPLGPVARRSWIRLERDVYRAAQCLFPMSAWAGSSLVQDYGVDPGRIVVAGAGTNLVGREPLHDGAGPAVALFIGLDFRRKGGRQLLACWPDVRRRLPGAELWIVGTRTQPHERDGVRWFGRIADRERLRGLYQQATVFVLPSLYDPFPHVLREALGQGLPCVTTDAGAIAEIVRGGEDSIIVPRDDASALGRALASLLGDPVRARAMGARGRERVLSEATWERVAARMAPHLQAAGAQAAGGPQ